MVFKNKINKRDFLTGPNTILKNLIIRSLSVRSIYNFEHDIVDRTFTFKITKRRGRVSMRLPFSFSGSYETALINEDPINEEITLNISMIEKEGKKNGENRAEE